jgi:hypothetical protein
MPLQDARVTRTQSQRGAFVQLLHIIPVKFLPGGLIDEWRRYAVVAASAKFCVFDQKIDTVSVEIDLDEVAGADQAEIASHRRFRRR